MEVVPQGIDTIQTSHKGVTDIPNGGTTTYNDNIHQNIFRSYKYINNSSFQLEDKLFLFLLTIQQSFTDQGFNLTIQQDCFGMFGFSRARGVGILKPGFHFFFLCYQLWSILFSCYPFFILLDSFLYFLKDEIVVVGFHLTHLPLNSRHVIIVYFLPAYIFTCTNHFQNFPR